MLSFHYSTLQALALFEQIFVAIFVVIELYHNHVISIYSICI